MPTRAGAAVVVLALLAACAADHVPTTHRRAEGALGPYSGSVVAGGFCFVSGKIGERGGSFRHEVETAIDAVEQELARADLTLADVVTTTVYLTDIEQYAAFNEIYAARLPAPHPARALVEVARLPGDARVEIQVVARIR